MLKVYDKVWIMENNTPVEKLVFAIVESMDFSKRGSEFHCHLVNEKCGAGWGNNEGIQRSLRDVYTTKKELLSSL